MIINDPVFGFIEVPDGLLTTLVKHPYVVRLTRIRQLGPTFYVYPGAMHTRFQHSLGTLYLVREALDSLTEKGVWISDAEREAVSAAMLLHDLGHGPMSHALEKAFVPNVEHETISLLLMERINKALDGALDLAIRIFKDEYPKRFLHELVCSQLDMDRLDYLCRDSFFTGVREGNIGVARIIKMLDVKDDRLVVEAKGIYTLENYLMARRLMYWQVYLHKTAMSAQEVLSQTVRRARMLALAGREIPCSSGLHYFLYHRTDETPAEDGTEWLDWFVRLDDSDIESAFKEWTGCDDRILSLLAQDFINRRLFKAKQLKQPLTDSQMNGLKQQMAEALGITLEEAAFLVSSKEIDQMLYSTKDDHISILLKDGSVRDISQFSELLSKNLIDHESKRFYLFYQRVEGNFEPDI